MFKINYFIPTILIIQLIQCVNSSPGGSGDITPGNSFPLPINPNIERSAINSNKLLSRYQGGKKHDPRAMDETKVSSAQLMELSDSATLKYEEMNQEQKNQIKAAYGLSTTGNAQSSGKSSGKKVSSAQLMELSDSATLKYEQMGQAQKNQIKAAYGLSTTGNAQSSGKSSGKKVSSAQLMELSDSATLKYEQMDQAQKNQIKAAYGLSMTGTSEPSKKKMSSAQLMELSDSATLKYEEMDQEKKNQIKAAYGLPPTENTKGKVSSAQLLEMSGGSAKKVSSAQLLDGLNRIQSLDRNSSFSSVSSFGSDSSSSSSKPKQLGFLERQKSNLASTFSMHTHTNSLVLGKEVQKFINEYLNKAVERRMWLEKELKVEKCTTELNYMRYRNKLAKALMYQYIIKNIYDKLDTKHEEVIASVEYQTLKFAVKSHEEISKQRTVTPVELQRFQETSNRYNIYKTRADRLAESMRMIKANFSIVNDDNDLDNMIYEIINQKEKVYAISVPVTTYKELVKANYQDWRLTYSRLADQQIEGKIRGHMENFGKQPKNPNLTVNMEHLLSLGRSNSNLS